MIMTNFTDKTAPGTPFLAEASQLARNSGIAKVMADINFLRDRIAQLRAHRNPNTAVLQTYTAMLTRREMALALMQDVGSRQP